MKKIDYSEYRKKRSSFVRQRVEAGLESAPNTKPRDALKRELLSEIDRKRWLEWLATGRLVKTGPRSYRYSTH